MAFVDVNTIEFMEVPDAAFVAPASPLTTEVTAWALANTIKFGSFVWKGGTVGEPIRVWFIGASPTYQATMVRGTPV